MNKRQWIEHCLLKSWDESKNKPTMQFQGITADLSRYDSARAATYRLAKNRGWKVQIKTIDNVICVRRTD